MRTLLIDDLRVLKADRVARTFDEGIKALQEGPWDLLLLDHDLGDPDPRHTGYDVLCWLEANPNFLPGQINPTCDYESCWEGKNEACHQQTVPERLYFLSSVGTIATVSDRGMSVSGTNVQVQGVH